MNVLYLLAAVAVALWLLGQIRVGGGLEYSGQGLRVWLRFGAWKLQIIPWRKKRRGSKKQKKEGEEKKPSFPQPESKPLAQQVGGALDYARPLIPILLDAAGSLRRKIRVDKLALTVTVRAADPADAALRYGTANAAMGALWGAINEAFTVRDGRADVQVDFETGQTTLYACTSLSLTVGQGVWLGLYFGGKALRSVLAVRKEKKREQQHRKAA